MTKAGLPTEPRRHRYLVVVRPSGRCGAMHPIPKETRLQDQIASIQKATLSPLLHPCRRRDRVRECVARPRRRKARRRKRERAPVPARALLVDLRLPPRNQSLGELRKKILTRSMRTSPPQRHRGSVLETRRWTTKTSMLRSQMAIYLHRRLCLRYLNAAKLSSSESARGAD